MISNASYVMPNHGLYTSLTRRATILLTRYYWSTNRIDQANNHASIESCQFDIVCYQSAFIKFGLHFKLKIRDRCFTITSTTITS